MSSIDSSISPAMVPAQTISNLFNAKPIGFRRWIAHCPNHPDGSEYVCILDGRHHRAILRCSGGCRSAVILATVGLRCADLFPPGMAKGQRKWAAGLPAQGAEAAR